MELCHLESRKEDGKKDQLVFSGLLTRENTGKIRLDLLQKVQSLPEHIVIVIKEVTEMDLSFLQLLQSLLNLMAGRNMSFQLNWLIDDEQLRLLHAAGFSKYI